MWVILQFLSLGILARAAAPITKEITLGDNDSLQLSLSSLFNLKSWTEVNQSTCKVNKGVDLLVLNQTALSEYSVGRSFQGPKPVAVSTDDAEDVQRIYYLMDSGLLGWATYDSESLLFEQYGKNVNITVPQMDFQCRSMAVRKLSSGESVVVVVCGMTKKEADESFWILIFDAEEFNLITKINYVLPQGLIISNRAKQIYLRKQKEDILVIYEPGATGGVQSNNVFAAVFNLTSSVIQSKGGVVIFDSLEASIMYDMYSINPSSDQVIVSFRRDDMASSPLQLSICTLNTDNSTTFKCDTPQLPKYSTTLGVTAFGANSKYYQIDFSSSDPKFYSCQYQITLQGLLSFTSCNTYRFFALPPSSTVKSLDANAHIAVVTFANNNFDHLGYSVVSEDWGFTTSLQGTGNTEQDPYSLGFALGELLGRIDQGFIYNVNQGEAYLMVDSDTIGPMGSESTVTVSCTRVTDRSNLVAEVKIKFLTSLVVPPTVSQEVLPIGVYSGMNMESSISHSSIQGNGVTVNSVIDKSSQISVQFSKTVKVNILAETTWLATLTTSSYFSAGNFILFWSEKQITGSVATCDNYKPKKQTIDCYGAANLTLVGQNTKLGRCLSPRTPWLTCSIYDSEKSATYLTGYSTLGDFTYFTPLPADTSKDFSFIAFSTTVVYFTVQPKRRTVEALFQYGDQASFYQSPVFGAILDASVMGLPSSSFCPITLQTNLESELLFVESKCDADHNKISVFSINLEIDTTSKTPLTQITYNLESVHALSATVIGFCPGSSEIMLVHKPFTLTSINIKSSRTRSYLKVLLGEFGLYDTLAKFECLSHEGVLVLYSANDNGEVSRGIVKLDKEQSEDSRLFEVSTNIGTGGSYGTTELYGNLLHTISTTNITLELTFMDTIPIYVTSLTVGDPINQNINLEFKVAKSSTAVTKKLSVDVKKPSTQPSISVKRPLKSPKDNILVIENAASLEGPIEGAYVFENPEAQSLGRLHLWDTFPSATAGLDSSTYYIIACESVIIALPKVTSRSSSSYYVLGADPSKKGNLPQYLGRIKTQTLAVGAAAIEQENQEYPDLFVAYSTGLVTSAPLSFLVTGLDGEITAGKATSNLVTQDANFTEIRVVSNPDQDVFFVAALDTSSHMLAVYSVTVDMEVSKAKGGANLKSTGLDCAFVLSLQLVKDFTLVVVGKDSPWVDLVTVDLTGFVSRRTVTQKGSVVKDAASIQPKYGVQYVTAVGYTSMNYSLFYITESPIIMEYNIVIDSKSVEKITTYEYLQLAEYTDKQRRIIDIQGSENYLTYRSTNSSINDTIVFYKRRAAGGDGHSYWTTKISKMDSYSIGQDLNDDPLYVQSKPTTQGKSSLDLSSVGQLQIKLLHGFSRKGGVRIYGPAGSREITVSFKSLIQGPFIMSLLGIVLLSLLGALCLAVSATFLYIKCIRRESITQDYSAYDTMANIQTEKTEIEERTRRITEEIPA